MAATVLAQLSFGLHSNAATSTQNGVAGASAAAPFREVSKLTGAGDICRDLVFIGARGSGETTKQHPFAMGDVVGTAFISWVNEIDERRVGYWPVPYPALPVAKIASNAKAYFKGLSRGVAKVQDLMEVRASRCPDEKYVLSGYSQGAMVVHRASWSASGDRVVGVLVAGDGDRRKREGATLAGTAPDSTGITWKAPNVAGSRAGTQAKALPGWAQDGRWVSVCDAKDPVCDPRVPKACRQATAIGLLRCVIDNQRNIAVHSGYTASDALRQAARSLAARAMSASNFTEPMVVSAPPLDVVEGDDFSGQFSVSGGVEPFSFSLVSSTLPGVAISSEGTLAGQIPLGFTDNGRREFSVRVIVADANGQQVDLRRTYEFGQKVEEPPLSREPRPFLVDHRRWGLQSWPSVDGSWLVFRRTDTPEGYQVAGTWEWWFADGSRGSLNEPTDRESLPREALSLRDGTMVVADSLKTPGGSGQGDYVTRVRRFGADKVLGVATAAARYDQGIPDMTVGTDGFIYVLGGGVLSKLDPGSLREVATIDVDVSSVSLGATATAVVLYGNTSNSRLRLVPYKAFGQADPTLPDPTPSPYAYRSSHIGANGELATMSPGPGTATRYCRDVTVRYEEPGQPIREFSLAGVDGGSADDTDCRHDQIRVLGGGRVVVSAAPYNGAWHVVFIDFSKPTPTAVVRNLGTRASMESDGAGRVHLATSEVYRCGGPDDCARATVWSFDRDGQLLSKADIPDVWTRYAPPPVMPGSGSVTIFGERFSTRNTTPLNVAGTVPAPSSVSYRIF